MKIFELDIPKLKYSRFFKDIAKHINSDSLLPGKMICTPNPEICLKTLHDKKFLKTLQKADYLTNDGIGLYIAYQIAWSGKGKFMNFFHLPVYFFNILFRKQYLYSEYGDRICGSDITDDLVNFCEQKWIHVVILEPYFPEDIAKCQAQENFNKNLALAFPYLRFDMYVYKEQDKKNIFKSIAGSDAKVIFSTQWMMKQEFTIIEAMKSCPNIRLGLGVGSSFDYFTGFQKRAPHLCRTLGMEWFYRIFTSPGKMKRLGRIYSAVIVFPMKVLFYNK